MSEEKLKYIDNGEEVKEEQIAPVVETVGRRVNLGNITPDEYNKFVSRVGNKFLNPEQGYIKCICGKSHKITKVNGVRKIHCDLFNITIKGVSRPRIYEKWIRAQSEIIIELEEMSKQIKENIKNDQ